MNNAQQLQGLLNSDMLASMVQRQQQEMSQQRGPQQFSGFPLERRISTTSTGAFQSIIPTRFTTALQQLSGNNSVDPAPLGGNSLSSPLAPPGPPKDLLVGDGGSQKRPDDDEVSLLSSKTRESVVDKDKVEAAFRSKPQPGKKRADLTEGERQELAKARNREHARQARMRKKARHAQLLHSEEMLVKMNLAEELKNKRCQNIFRFLSIRGYMLMHLEDDVASASQQLANSVACTSLLSEVVEDMDTFYFDSNMIATNNFNTTDENSSLSSMREWDKALKRRLVTKFGPGCTDKLVNYKVVNGKNGIALSADHTGFARVEIMITVDGETRTVLSGILVTHFHGESAKFAGISWATMREQ